MKDKDLEELQLSVAIVLSQGRKVKLDVGGVKIEGK
jgi:hypothetical protein